MHHDARLAGWARLEGQMFSPRGGFSGAQGTLGQASPAGPAQAGPARPARHRRRRIAMELAEMLCWLPCLSKKWPRAERGWADVPLCRPQGDARTPFFLRFNNRWHKTFIHRAKWGLI